MEHTCKVTVGFEKLLIPTSKKGVSKVIDNPLWSPLFREMDNPWECKEGQIPVDVVLCNEDATEHISEIYKRNIKGMGGTGHLLSSGILKVNVDIAFCPKHHKRFLEDQDKIKQDFEKLCKTTSE